MQRREAVFASLTSSRARTLFPSEPDRQAATTWLVRTHGEVTSGLSRRNRISSAADEAAAAGRGEAGLEGHRAGPAAAVWGNRRRGVRPARRPVGLAPVGAQ